ncbi:hypothetical protein B0T26DRAFT_758585, partial [Lasiosphaeria miniovina]
MCLIIEALDECVDLTLLVNLVVQTSSTCPSVKWIVSSRNTWSIKERLDADAVKQKARLSLESAEWPVSEAITEYIHIKVEVLAWRDKDDNATWGVVKRCLSENGHGNFLWISLVFQEFENTPRSEVQTKLARLPDTIMGLYRTGMNRLRESNNNKLYRKILAVVSVAENPITLDELAVVVDTLDGLSGHYDALAEITGLCSPFLRLYEYTVSIAHLSAKDF